MLGPIDSFLLAAGAHDLSSFSTALSQSGSGWELRLRRSAIILLWTLGSGLGNFNHWSLLLDFKIILMTILSHKAAARRLPEL
jgi:hypothetical protein